MKVIEKLNYWQGGADLLDQVIAGERERALIRQIGMREATHDEDQVM